MISITRLTFQDDAFDWSSLCQLPYVLSHELLCHAYQGIATSRNEPRLVVDRACAWTEGWMDVLALWTAQRWLDELETHPGWVATELGSLHAEFVNRHARRTRPQSNLTHLERFRRMAAQDALNHLVREMRKFSAGEESGDFRDRIYSFSLNFNALGISPDTRNRVLDKLANALDSAFPLNRDEAVSAITEFARNPDLSVLKRR